MMSRLLESMEKRTMLSVSASVSGGTLVVNGSNSADVIQVSGAHIPTGTSTATRGTTSVFLDLPLLKTAAKLELTGASSSGTPANSNFQVGFPITPAGAFTYQSSGAFAPVSGSITHTGTVTFNNAITVGNFTIGFDASRATGNKSGFFVQDTAGGLGILFDVGAPTGLISRPTALSITGADLLVSPEFNAILNSLGLASSNLTGADVGNARIDAGAKANLVEGVVVRSPGLPGGSASFAGSTFSNVTINANGGDDAVAINRVRVTGDILVNAGEGSDSVAVINGKSNRLTLNGAGGNDNLAVVYGKFTSTRIDAGAGNDYLALSGVQTGGNASILGGAGADALLAVGSGVRSADVNGVEAPLIV